LKLKTAIIFHTRFMDWNETKIRVRYAETDAMGVVHHANYLVWFELGRSELCRTKGFSYREMEQDGALLVVAEAYCRYKSSAFYDDELTIRTKVAELKSRTMRFVYEVFRESDQTLLAEGETTHVVTDANKKVRSMPEIYRQKMLAETIKLDLAMPEDQAPH
jgi:acyl-CoA thioester hydrolase